MNDLLIEECFTDYAKTMPATNGGTSIVNTRKNSN